MKKMSFWKAYSDHQDLASGVVDYKVVLLTISGSVNVCVLVFLIVWWTSRCRHRTKIVASNDTHSTISRLTSILLSPPCIAGGVYVIATPSTWSCTFACRTSLDPGVLLVLGAGWARFVFELFLLLAVSTTRRGSWSAWSQFRSVYLVSAIVCLGTVILTHESIVVGATIMIIEVDLMILEVVKVLKQYQAHRSLVVVLSSIGSILCIGMRAAVAVVIVVVSYHRVNPIDMSPVSLGVFCFSAIFFLSVSGFIVRRLIDETRLPPTDPRQTTIAGWKARRPQILPFTDWALLHLVRHGIKDVPYVGSRFFKVSTRNKAVLNSTELPYTTLATVPDYIPTTVTSLP